MSISRNDARTATLALALLGSLVVGSAWTAGAQETPAPAPTGPTVEIAEAAVCTAVEERAPVGASDRFPAGTERLYCFTDVRGAEGQTLVHAWIHDGVTRARVELPVKAARWRTWSSKELLPEWTGAWEVKVLTADGAVLQTLSFTLE